MIRLSHFLALMLCFVAAWTATAEEPRRAGPDWWSIQKIVKPEPPKVKQAGWVTNPIDAFVLAKLEGKGLTPSAPADRLKLIRRVTFDLIGLPPTPQEIDQFLRDSEASPDAAYEKLIDRLLSSPHYGERWGRHWLDAVRFSESHGFERDQPRDNSYRYRDYVIKAFNEDKRYADFVREQLAGDVGPLATQDGIAATGLLVAGPWDEVGEKAPSPSVRARAREDELEDILSTVGQTFLGLTVNCARCHDHKFDPFPTRDYYRLKAVFDGVWHGERPLLAGDELKYWQVVKSRFDETIKAAQSKIADIEKRGRMMLPKGGERPSREQIHTVLAEEDRQELIRLEKLVEEQQAALGNLMIGKLAYAAVSKQPGPTHVLKRGDSDSPGDEVAAGPPSQVAGPPIDFDLAADAAEGQRRLKLAEWIVHRDNPLAWRVIVNRIWQHHFGEGIVRTPNDFGRNGEAPSHPELLDWLAATFRDDGGRLKSLHRLILLSSTYRQASTVNSQALNVDADNRLLWRYAPRRLEAEAVRDAMLAVSGRLNLQAGGPSFRPFKIRVANSTFYDLFDDDAPEFNRRSVYRMNINSAKDPLLDALDCPDPTVKTPRRAATTTPLQALTMMNNAFAQRQARYLAERAAKETSVLDEQIALAYRLALGRPPNEDELRRAAVVAREHGLRAICWALLNASEFVYNR